MININTPKIVTGKVRLSYVHLFTPFTSLVGGEPKYSVTILLPKTDTVTKRRLDEGIQLALMKGLSSKWDGVKPQSLAFPIHDGDGVRPTSGKPFGKECKGHWVFQASSRQAPEIVDLSRQRIVNPSEIYSGVYAKVSIRFYPYFTKGRSGIGCGLSGVQKIGDGEMLGARIKAPTNFGGGGTPSGFTPIGEVIDSIINSLANNYKTGAPERLVQ